jgi:hypothetical protein
LVFSRVFLENIVHIDRGICDAAEKLGVPFTVVVFGSRSLVNDSLLSRACRPSVRADTEVASKALGECAVKFVVDQQESRHIVLVLDKGGKGSSLEEQASQRVREKKIIAP